MKKYDEIIKNINEYKEKIKKTTKTYYLSDDVIKVINNISKEYNISTSEVVNESLRYCFDLK